MSEHPLHHAAEGSLDYPCDRCGGDGWEPFFDGDGEMECRRCKGTGTDQAAAVAGYIDSRKRETP